MENIQYSNSKRALLVIDIQEDYTGTTAKPPFPYKDSERLIATVNGVIEEAVSKNITVVYIRQEFDGFIGKMISRLAGHGTAIKGNAGAEFDKRINIISDHCYTKPMPDAFTNPELERFLSERKIKEIYLVGLDAEGCVYFTARGALKRGYSVSIIKDSILLLKEERWDSLLSKFRKDGITLINSQEL